MGKQRESGTKYHVLWKHLLLQHSLLLSTLIQVKSRLSWPLLQTRQIKIESWIFTQKSRLWLCNNYPYNQTFTFIVFSMIRGKGTDFLKFPSDSNINIYERRCASPLVLKHTNGQRGIQLSYSQIVWILCRLSVGLQ